jgi:uncharacterized membrane protein YtjA (UPF0391 family)
MCVTMAQARETQGHALATLGAVGLVASLWSPWYSFRIPGSVLDQAVQSAQQYGVLAPIISQGAALVRQLGPIQVNAWQVFTATPAALLVVGVIAAGLSLLTLAGRATGVSRIVVRVGVAGLVISLYRLAVRPAPSDILHAAWGLDLALAANIAVIVGGLLGGMGEREHARAPATVEANPPPGAAAWPVATSVPPPRSG